MPETSSSSKLIAQIPSLHSLAQPDEGAWKTLEGLIPLLDGQDLEPGTALVVETAARVLTLREAREEQDGEGESTSICQMSEPAMLWALEHSTTEPLAFARALVETMRELSEELDQGPRLAKTVRRLLDEAALEKIDPGGAEGLQALVLSYLAEHLRFRPDKERKVGRWLQQARVMGERADPEIQARILEVEARIKSASGQIGHALDLLSRSLGLLKYNKIPGRREEVMLALARVELERSKPERAMVLLSQVAASPPYQAPSRIRLELLVTQARAWLGLQEYGSARSTIAAAAELVESPMELPHIKAERLWVEGHLALLAKEWSRAIGHFAEAVDLYLVVYETPAAIQALVDGMVGIEMARGSQSLDPIRHTRIQMSLISKTLEAAWGRRWMRSELRTVGRLGTFTKVWKQIQGTLLRLDEPAAGPSG